MTDKEYERFHVIIDLVPTFKPVLLRFVEDPLLLVDFVTKVSDCMLFKLFTRLINMDICIAQFQY